MNINPIDFLRSINPFSDSNKETQKQILYVPKEVKPDTFELSTNKKQNESELMLDVPCYEAPPKSKNNFSLKLDSPVYKEPPVVADSIVKTSQKNTDELSFLKGIPCLETPPIHKELLFLPGVPCLGDIPQQSKEITQKMSTPISEFHYSDDNEDDYVEDYVEDVFEKKRSIESEKAVVSNKTEENKLISENNGIVLSGTNKEVFVRTKNQDGKKTLDIIYQDNEKGIGEQVHVRDDGSYIHRRLKGHVLDDKSLFDMTKLALEQYKKQEGTSNSDFDINTAEKLISKFD